MCWEKISGNKPCVRKNKWDIIVYKVLRLKDDKLLSYFKSFEYAVQKVYSIDNGLTVQQNLTRLYSITEGFHSYDARCCVRAWLPGDFFETFAPSEVLPLNQYYNSNSEFRGGTVLVRCVIPEGSVYYENEDGEIVSDKIMLTDQIIPYDRLGDYIKSHPDKTYISFDNIFKSLKK